MVEDAVGRVQREAVGTVGGGVVSDYAELLAIGGEEEVVAGGGAGMPKGEEGREAAVDGHA